MVYGIHHDHRDKYGTDNFITMTLQLLCKQFPFQASRCDVPNPNHPTTATTRPQSDTPAAPAAHLCEFLPAERAVGGGGFPLRKASRSSRRMSRLRRRKATSSRVFRCWPCWMPSSVQRRMLSTDSADAETRCGRGEHRQSIHSDRSEQPQ